MDELIRRLAAQAGIDAAVADKTIGIIRGFLRSEGPSDKVQALIDRIPGAEAATATSAGGSGLVGCTLVGCTLVGFMGRGGLMAVGAQLMGLGLGTDQIQNVAGEFFRFGRNKIGADKIGEIISGTPGLGQIA